MMLEMLYLIQTEGISAAAVMDVTSHREEGSTAMRLDRRPDIVLIHVDELRGDSLGDRHGRRELYTPALNAMMAEGLTFNSAYTACPVCIPQRLTLLTGQNPEHHGVMSMTGIPYFETETTLPSELKKGGYQTALVGRTMHTYPESETYGFEYYRPGDPTMHGQAGDCFKAFLERELPEDKRDYCANGTALNSRMGAPFQLDNYCHQTEWATNRALEFIRNRDDSRPFFLSVGYLAPHTPLNPPAEYFHRYYDDDIVDQPYIAPYDIAPVTNGSITSHYVDLKGEELRSMEAAYYGLISHIDAQAARIIEALRYTNTWIIFTSDHGEMLGDHYCVQKSRVWQGSVHIPFIVRPPFGRGGGRVISDPVGWADIMPTVLSLAGLPIPDSVDGVSLAGRLSGQSDVPVRDYFHGECLTIDYHHFGNYMAQRTEGNLMDEKGAHFLTDGAMKYIWYEPDGREQLFNVREDYGELNDLSHDPDRAEEMKMWRERLTETLKNRPEGFVKDGKLVTGPVSNRLEPKAQELYDRRKKEGQQIAYDTVPPTFIPGPKGYMNKY